MNRRDFLQVSSAAVVGGFVSSAIDDCEAQAAGVKGAVPESISDDDTFLWGNTCLPAILETLGVASDQAKAVRLHFEYGQFATATFTHADDTETMRVLPLFGTNVISSVIGAPKYLQAITIGIEKEHFTVCNCRYVPLHARIDDVIAALNTVDA